MKRILQCILLVAILSMTTVSVHSVELEYFTSDEFEEYIEKHRRAAEAAGYKSLPSASSAYSDNSQSESTKTEEKKIIETCDHLYEDTIVVEPTCVNEGEMVSTCSKCNDSYKTVISATGEHDYECTATKEATCTEIGEITYTCKTCNDFYIEEIPKLSHEYECENIKAVTCVEAGENSYTCKLCGASYTEEILPIGHIAGEWIVAKNAGIFSEGERIKKCINCDEICETEIISSKYPIYYLYIGITVSAILVLGGFAYIILKKKRRL